ncbi:hypothetical protein JX265_005136 [Neoarthrinium moseri]|uniref:Peptidyl-tRNA hydrolase n=1 Tax=Neoarthrinium moseri TaxID=1658444 RepID=A0A9P9WPB9_9PEZI|nr:uncharacterized protein JN550_012347 [Neoarthrinium moseri]KAI1843083.1 hypothetical protein JX266_010772 [Neoarthrinium moseri]KAI1858888.1 hypothetical protein JN550_012347 [Neoarthrinium moseri]KAI1873514.1 hypothetical protein JX265_005136 [Neoarthrinium moseri]
MRFSAASALLGLPLLASAQDVPEYQAQFQNYLDKFMSYVPNPSKSDPIGAAQAKAGSLKMDILTLNNWRDVLYSHVTPQTETPEETWVLITGGNKTCFGHCEKVETAFNQTAAKFALTPGAPHTALLNCENEPVLCNSWSAPTGALWIFEMLPPPAEINLYAKRFNLTTVTSDDFAQLQKEGHKTNAKLHDGIFHPINGWFAQNGVQTPVGYVLWFFNLVPSWLFMVVVSMVSRTMMGNRMGQQGARAGPRPAATGQAQAR